MGHRTWGSEEGAAIGPWDMRSRGEYGGHRPYGIGFGGGCGGYWFIGYKAWILEEDITL